MKAFANQIHVNRYLLIAERRSKGYRPILLIDANSDYVHGKDTTLGSFLLNTGLQDPFLSCYKDPIHTYLRGSNRIDYIFMDGALTPQSVQRISYLGTHDGAISDHVLAYVDMDHPQMFAGTITQATTTSPSRYNDRTGGQNPGFSQSPPQPTRRA